ncbi:hypothetical protein HZC07_00815 [Candidatus Micrarchaeota archaeon]|nr:hypothetical protein [Candidatus Micrarchaeota archaeon]
MRETTKLFEILSIQHYLLVLGTLAAILLPLLLISSAILVPSTAEINPVAEPVGIFLVLVIGLLMAVNWTVLLYVLDSNQKTNETKIGKQSGLPVVGSVVAFFGSACPICQPIWLVWLGLGSGTAFLAQYGIYISLLSIGLLIFSLRSSLQSAMGICQQKNQQKSNGGR